MITIYPKGKPHTSLYLLAQNVRIKQSHWTLLKSWGWEQENKVWASEWGWSEVPGGLLSRAFRPYLMQLSLCQCTECHLSTHNLESTPEQWLSSRCQHPESVFLIKIMLPYPLYHRLVFWILVSYLIATSPLSNWHWEWLPFQRSHCNQLFLSEESLWKFPSNRMWPYWNSSLLFPQGPILGVIGILGWPVIVPGELPGVNSFFCF